MSSPEQQLKARIEELEAAMRREAEFMRNSRHVPSSNFTVTEERLSRREQIDTAKQAFAEGKGAEFIMGEYPEGRLPACPCCGKPVTPSNSEPSKVDGRPMHAMCPPLPPEDGLSERDSSGLLGMFDKIPPITKDGNP